MAILRQNGFQDALVALAEEAGRAILRVRQQTDFAILEKSDKSPVTAADLAANEIIVAALPGILAAPIVSEESRNDQDPGALFWLVDPLDGTKEFIAGRGDFTVNIALVQEGFPIFGVVHAPTRDLTYWGGAGIGAWRKRDGVTSPINVCHSPASPLRVVASASHLNDETRDYLGQLGDHVLVQAGSPIKICMIAEGSADLYPRLGPTCEWDTAAADAVLRGAGGGLTQMSGEPLLYGKPEILNPFFIAGPGRA
jgi:3'(2'), 5'-bisphosphate nucleotidase